MNRFKVLPAIILALAISPGTSAQIYKCDGPDGPIFSDKKCGTDAKTVDVLDSSGLTGVSDETKAELAAKKADREKARNEGHQLNNNRAVSNNQNITEPAGRWRYPYYRGAKPGKPGNPVVKPRPLPSAPGPRRK